MDNDRAVKHKIFVIGFMGCGKTHWSKLWSSQFNIPFYDLDDEIEQKQQQTIAQIFSQLGEERFRELETLELDNFRDKNNYIVSCGGGTPCYNNNMNLINKIGISIYLECSKDTLYERLVKEKSKRPLIKNLSDEELRKFISVKLEERKKYYQHANIILNEEQVLSFNINNIH